MSSLSTEENFEYVLQEIIDLFARLSFDKLDDEWVSAVINSDFTEVGNLPEIFEDFHLSTNFVALFKAIINALRNFIDYHLGNANNASTNVSLDKQVQSEQRNEPSSSENIDACTRFWNLFAGKNLIKPLMAYIFNYVYQGQKYDANSTDRELAIYLGCVYFLLLSIPGSNAFGGFHCTLYMKTLDLLKLVTKLNLGCSSPKKGKGIRGGSSRCSSEESPPVDFDDDDDYQEIIISPQEAAKVVRLLNFLINDFMRYISRVSLKHSSESIEDTIYVLVEATRCETQSANFFICYRNPESVSSLAYNAYSSLQVLCSHFHGNSKKTLFLVMKYILPNILMTARGSSDISTRALNCIREHALVFIKYLVTQLKEVTYDGIYVLIQQLCIHVPDKADFRAKISSSIIEILHHVPTYLYTKIMEWLFKFSHNEKAGHRLFTLEVISKMLEEEERQAEQPEENNLSSNLKNISIENSDNRNCNEFAIDHVVTAPCDRNILSHKFLLCIVFSRCRDTAATVRSKALSLFAECTLSKNPSVIEAVKQICLHKQPLVFTTPHIPNNEINCESPFEMYDSSDTNNFKLPNLDMVIDLLKRRALDNKVMVFEEHCRDPALFIRKQMVTSLSDLVTTYPSSLLIVRSWVKGILPLLVDHEIRVQEKAIEAVDQVIFKHLQPYNLHKKDDPYSKFPWSVLNIVNEEFFQKFLNKFMQLWSKSSGYRSNIIHIMKTHIGHEYNAQTWEILALLSQYVEIKELNFITSYFTLHYQGLNTVDVCTLQHVLKMLCNTVTKKSYDDCYLVMDLLMGDLQNFLVPRDLISLSLDAVVLVINRLEEDSEKGQKCVEEKLFPIVNLCDEYLQNILFQKNDENCNEDILHRVLLTLGDVYVLCPSKANKRIFLMIQSILFNCATESQTQVDPIPSTQTQSSQPPKVAYQPSSRIQSLAVVTLGKMCLPHEDQAKRIVPALGRMMMSTRNPMLKINIIFVLSDMSVRFATLVDPLMPQITACLKDLDLEVRKTSLTLLINLLQEDYLKLKGSFFYRILQCLCDSHEEIRNIAEFYIIERLLKRCPKVLLQHFIDCIFHYNSYEEHESYNKFAISDQEKELFSLAGDNKREDRMKLYKFMLDHMPDDQRFFTTQKLCQDILGGIVSGKIKLSDSSLPVIQDTFSVLSCEEIKLASLKSRLEDTDQPTDKDEEAALAGYIIKKNIISQVVKKNVLENIVPILLSLRHRLEEENPQLMKNLLLYLKDLMKDYKNEIKEVLAGDKQLIKEIEFDLKLLEQAEAKEKENVLNKQPSNSVRSKQSYALSEKDGNKSIVDQNGVRLLSSLSPNPINRSNCIVQNKEVTAGQILTIGATSSGGTHNPEEVCTESVGNGENKFCKVQDNPRFHSSHSCKTLTESNCIVQNEKSSEVQNLSAIAAFIVRTNNHKEIRSMDNISNKIDSLHINNAKGNTDLLKIALLNSKKSKLLVENDENKQKNFNDNSSFSTQNSNKHNSSGKQSELFRAISTPQKSDCFISNVTFNCTELLSPVRLNNSFKKTKSMEISCQSVSVQLERLPSRYDEFSRLMKDNCKIQKSNAIVAEQDTNSNDSSQSHHLFQSLDAQGDSDTNSGSCSTIACEVQNSKRKRRELNNPTSHIFSSNGRNCKNKSKKRK